MTQTDKAALTDRLSNIGMVTPTLAEGQPDTVRDIDTITGEVLEAKRVGGEAIITIGQRLIEAKAMLPHGEWMTWLSEKVEFSERAARRFMQLARECTNRPALANLGATKALTLLALPESEREEFIAENNVVDMTSRELEKAIKERDEARKAAEQAKASWKTVEELRKAAREGEKQATDRVTELEKQLAELKAAPVEVAVMEVDQAQLDAARAEGEAAKAEELARLQAELEKARSAAADPDAAKFEVYFNQAQEVANKLRGLLIKARSRADQTAADKLARAMVALGEKIKEAAQ